MHTPLENLAYTTPVALVIAAVTACSPAPLDIKTPPPAPTSAAVSCPQDTSWDGSKCAPVAAPIAKVDCPAGSHLDQGSCVPDVQQPPPPATPEPPKCPDGMALVQGGEFVLGSRREKVTIAALCMDKTEVTADQYATCVKTGKCNTNFTKCSKEATYEVEGKGNHPMVCVDFPQAEAYCTAQNKRLPSEAEWEWVARGGPEGRTFPWGENPPKDQLCWSGSSSGPKTETCPVGSFPDGANPQGILDLSGSVFEWTTNKTDKVSPVRVARGGSWKDGVKDLVRVARPGGFKPDYRCGFLGIRCVTEAPPELAAQTKSP